MRKDMYGSCSSILACMECKQWVDKIFRPWVGNHVNLENMKGLHFRYECIEGREGEGEEEHDEGKNVWTLILGLKWLCHLSLHCFPTLPLNNWAIWDHFFKPCCPTNIVSNLNRKTCKHIYEINNQQTGLYPKIFTCKPHYYSLWMKKNNQKMKEYEGIHQLPVFLWSPLSFDDAGIPINMLLLVVNRNIPLQGVFIIALLKSRMVAKTPRQWRSYSNTWACWGLKAWGAQPAGMPLQGSGLKCIKKWHVR